MDIFALPSIIVVTVCDMLQWAGFYLRRILYLPLPAWLTNHPTDDRPDSQTFAGHGASLLSSEWQSPPRHSPVQVSQPFILFLVFHVMSISSHRSSPGDPYSPLSITAHNTYAFIRLFSDFQERLIARAHFPPDMIIIIFVEYYNLDIFSDRHRSKICWDHHSSLTWVYSSCTTPLVIIIIIIHFMPVPWYCATRIDSLRSFDHFYFN